MFFTVFAINADENPLGPMRAEGVILYQNLRRNCGSQSRVKAGFSQQIQRAGQVHVTKSATLTLATTIFSQKQGTESTK